jgi:signal transduction histidine kinase
LILQKSDIKYSIIQGIITLCIAFIPIYFYIDATIENQNIQDKISLKNYSSMIASKIDSVAYEGSETFYYPRSNIYKSAIYDHQDKVIFSLFDSIAPPFFTTEFFQDSQRIYHKHYLQSNILGAKYLITCKKINHSEVIYNVLILLITVTCLIFLSSFITIKQSIEPYKQLNLYLDNFLKDAMHELKTPLGVARINIDMLQMKLENNKHLIRIKSALKNMTVVYEDLEYYMQRHSVKNDKKQIDFSIFLEKRVEFFSDLAIAKNIEFQTNIQKDVTIFFNDIALYRIIDNNLSNAIKYSKDQSSIKVSLQQIDDTQIILKFQDNGIGIQDTQKIFHRYYRGDTISGGFGIGLSIVKRICDQNSIDIKVESQVRKGSTFIYTFYPYS